MKHASAIYILQESLWQLEARLYNILIEFGITMKLVRQIKMCTNETYNRGRVGKHLSDMCLIKNGLKQGDALSPLLFNFALEYDIRSV